MTDEQLDTTLASAEDTAGVGDASTEDTTPDHDVTDAMEAAWSDHEQGEADKAKEELPPEETPHPAPQHWNEEAKAMWTKQSRESQDFILAQHRAMEAAHTRRSQEIAPLTRFMGCLLYTSPSPRDS